MKTRTRILLSFLLGFWAPARGAHADSLSGIIDDPALRRTIDLVYLERVEGTLPPPAEVLITQKGLTFLPRVNPAGGCRAAATGDSRADDPSSGRR